MVLVLLSPAKTLDFDIRRGGLKATTPYFAARTSELVAALKKYSQAKLQKMMDISDTLAQLNAERFKNFTSQPQSSAILAYRGDVYQGFNADGLSDADLQWSHQHIGILSGLYGVLQPLDEIRAYRLEMSIKVPVGIYKNLYEFWGEDITAHLNKLIRKNKISTVIGCASQEYLGVVQTDRLKAPFIQCDFKEMKMGKPVIVALFAKKARGMMARYVVEHRVTEAAQLKKFDYAGYKFDRKLSTDDNFVFVR